MTNKAIAGWFADRGNSRRGPYLWGLIALAVSTLAFSVGRTKWVLFLGRLVNGASSAIVHTVGMAILADTVGQSGIGPAMGFVTLSIALGLVAGPILGGIIYHQLGYLAVFVSAYILVGLDFVLRLLMIMDERKESDGDRDPKSNERAGVDYGTVSTKVSKPNRSPSSNRSPSIKRCQSVSASLHSAKSSLLRSDSPTPSKSHPHPVLILLSTPRFLVAILGDFMQSVVLTSLEAVLPNRIKLVFNYNSQLVAFVFLPLSLAPLLGPFLGHLSDRFGAKLMVCSGFLLTAPLLILLRLVDHYDEGQVALLCCLLLVIGMGLNMILTPVFSEVTYAIEALEAKDPGLFGKKGAYAQAFGLMNVSYAAGSLVGPLVGGLLVGKVGWNGLTLAMGLVCAGCAVPCFLATGGRREGKKDEAERGDVG